MAPSSESALEGTAADAHRIMHTNITHADTAAPDRLRRNIADIKIERFDQPALQARSFSGLASAPRLECSITASRRGQCRTDRPCEQGARRETRCASVSRS